MIQIFGIHLILKIQEILGQQNQCPKDQYAMNNWKPITDSEFNNLFQSQYAELDSTQKNTFNRFRVPFWKARIRRGKFNVEEFVFVVAQIKNGVLYFDDVEYGFNISIVDPDGRIIAPGGSQNTLKESIDEWFTGAV